MSGNACTGWAICSDSRVGLTLISDVPQLAQPILPISYQPKQIQEDGGTAKIKVNPPQLSEQMVQPVVKCHDSTEYPPWRTAPGCARRGRSLT